MTIKVQCGCGTRYAFDVEPQNGVMPFPISCPSCNADGTAAANQLIAEAPRLRIHSTTAAPVLATAEDAPRPPISAPPPGSAMKKIEAERREMRKYLWMVAGVAAVLVALAGAYAWYSFVGCKPRLASSAKLPGPDYGWHAQFLDNGQILLVGADRVLVRDIHSQKDIWSTAIAGKTPDDMEVFGGSPGVLVDKGNIWICPGNRVLRLDEKSGEVKQTIPIQGRFASFTPTDSTLLVVSATGETKRVAMQIDLASGEASSRTVEIPITQKHAMPDELPTNVAPTAGVLLAQATEEQKFNKSLTAVSSEFFSTGQNLVELRVTLLEPKVTWVQAIKPRGPSKINGQTTASTSAAAVAEEVFNDIKRDQTGGVKSIDESRYQVRLRRWTADKPVEWKGEVTGVPHFFALATVDLLVAGKSLSVFDKQNNKLFDAQLSYPIAEQFGGEFGGRSVPAAERAGVLYFFDEGVLTALSLPGGQVLWRLTSIGISGIQFDGKGLLYVDTTGAAPEDIQYSEQIKLQSAPPIIMKVDPRLGKILWQVKQLGQRTVLSGKYVYTVSADRGGLGLAMRLAEAVNSPKPVTSQRFHICRLDPSNGDVVWREAFDDIPEEETFQKNCFVLLAGNTLQTWKFLDF